jgi:hypothetical protein
MALRMEAVVRRTRRHWLTVSFVLGFITDLILLNKVDDLVDNLILLFYVLLATTSFFLLYVGVAERAPGFFNHYFKLLAPVAMQYSFGGLLSGMLIFYGRSGDWVASAPFLLLILTVIIGNEFVSKRSDRLIYHLALYFIGLFSYVVLVVPVLTGKMGDLVFIFSGAVALVLVTVVVQILYRIVPHFMALNTQRVIFSIGMIYVGFNTLYFTSIIPPIPLSLTELMVVQSVQVSTGATGLKTYRIEMEDRPWYSVLPFMRPTIHPTGNSIACFARVYAPTRLSTEIFHRWEYKDERGDWQTHDRIGYGIQGTNVNGYGGYTQISAFSTGVWRCSVETKRGQVLGRETVNIVYSNETVIIKTHIK